MGNSPGGNPDGPGNHVSEDQARAATLGPEDFQTVNFNLTTPQEKAMGERVTLSASGREKMGIQTQVVEMTTAETPTETTRPQVQT